VRIPGIGAGIISTFSTFCTLTSGSEVPFNGGRPDRNITILNCSVFFYQDKREPLLLLGNRELKATKQLVSTLSSSLTVRARGSHFLFAWITPSQLHMHIVETTEYGRILSYTTTVPTLHAHPTNMWIENINSPFRKKPMTCSSALLPPCILVMLHL